MSVGIEGVHWVHHLSSTSIRAARNDSNAPTTTGIASKPANLVTVRDIGLTASTKMDWKGVEIVILTEAICCNDLIS